MQSTVLNSKIDELLAARKARIEQGSHDLRRLYGHPVCEIEITQEMIEAGINELSPRVIVDLRDGWIRPSVVASRIFFAMLQAAP